MTYTDQSPLHSNGTVSAESIDAWFAAHGNAPTGLGKAIVDESSAAGLNSDLVAAQTALETGYWTSRIALDKNNPAGIGAENDDPYGKAIAFPSVAAGVYAQIEHLLTYVLGDGPWGTDDPRYEAVKAAGWLGSVRVLRDLNGRWAFPGTTYGADIAAWANELVRFANDGTWSKPVAGDDSRFQWVPDPSEFGYPQGTHGRNGKPIDYLIVHVTEGTDSLAWLRDAHGSSTHYLTNRDATPRAQLVAEADAAWTAGSAEYNLRAINIEFERFAKDEWTDAEVANAVATCAPILARHNIPVDYLARNSVNKRGIIGHQDVPDGNGGWGGTDHHTDPGPKFPWDKFIAGLQPPHADDNPPPRPPEVTDTTARYFPETDRWIQWAFKGKYDELGAFALPIIGYPLTNELAEDGLTVQYFERARFEWHADTQQVMLSRLGAEALARKQAAPHG